MRIGRTGRRPLGRAGSVDELAAHTAPHLTSSREPTPSTTTVATRTVDLRVLVLSSGDEEPSAQAWCALLESAGVPFDCVIVGRDPLQTASLEWAPLHGRYQAVILATDSLVRQRDGVYVSSFSEQEWAVLHDFLRAYDVRQISAYATPGPSLGLQPASWAGDLADSVATLTDAGREVFPDLVGDVPMSPGTYGYRTAPEVGADFTTLLAGESDSPVVGVFRHPDGREELLVTVASGPSSRHMHLLGPGMLHWVTRGRHLGHHGFFLSVQVDDILLGATVPAGSAPIRMTPDDVHATERWSQENAVRFDFGFNGWGAVSATMGGDRDPLTETLLSTARAFNWVNHTFGHLDLDHATAAEITDEITRNLAWAAENDIDVPLDTLITGAHSGLENPALAEVADECGIRWIAADASRDRHVRSISGAHAVPRHPVNIPLDVSTCDGLLRRRGGVGAAGVDTIDRTEVLAMEATLMLTHLLTNDPRPHYTHQNALVDDRLLLALLDGVLQSYRAMIVRAPVQLSLAEAGQELVRRAMWSDLSNSNAITARAIDGSVEIVNHCDRVVEVPYAGLADQDGSRESGWIAVAANDRVVLGR